MFNGSKKACSSSTNNYDGFDPNSTEAYIIFSLYQNAYLDQSLSFAADVQKHVKSKTGLYDRGVKQAGFLVLWKTAMPAILVESGFLSNVSDEDYLSSEKGQDNIANGIFNAFKEYKTDVEGSKEILDTESSVSKDTIAKPIIIKDTTSIKKDTSSKSSVKKEIFFKVQFASSSVKKSVNSPDFKGLKDVKEYYHNGMYKYVSGNETTFEDALKLLEKIHNLGFKDAFIVAFLNGERISPQDAVKLIKKN